MNALTFEETNLLCIYNPGTRQGAIEALTEMRGHLQADEDELLALTDSTLAKLRAMTDADRDRDCSLAMAVSYGLDCDTEAQRRDDYYAVRGLKR